MQFDRSKSLQQLEGRDWGEPEFDSHLVTECHRLHRVPLRDFTAENLRIMIGQQISLPHLVPIALELLNADPLVAGDFYEGDLLMAVLRVESAFWRKHPVLRNATDEIARRALSLLPPLDESGCETARNELEEAYAVFNRGQ